MNTAYSQTRPLLTTTSELYNHHNLPNETKRIKHTQYTRNFTGRLISSHFWKAGASNCLHELPFWIVNYQHNVLVIGNSLKAGRDCGTVCPHTSVSRIWHWTVSTAS